MNKPVFSRRLRCALNRWRKIDGPFWHEIAVKGRPYRYHVITARDATCWDAKERKR